MLVLSGRTASFEVNEWGPIDGRSGVSRKLTVRTDDGSLETVKIAEELWATLAADLRDGIAEFGREVEVGVRVVLLAYEGQKPKVQLNMLGVRVFDGAAG